MRLRLATAAVLLVLLSGTFVLAQERPSVYVHARNGILADRATEAEQFGAMVQARLTRTGKLLSSDRVAILREASNRPAHRSGAGLPDAVARERPVDYVVYLTPRRIKRGEYFLDVTISQTNGYQRHDFLVYGEGGSIWEAMHEPLDEVVSRVLAWVEAVESDDIFRSDPMGDYSFWYVGQFAWIPFGRGEASSGDDYDDNGPIALNIALQLRDGPIHTGVAVWALPLLETRGAPELPFDEKSRGDVDFVQMDLNFTTELYVGHAEITGNYHLTELLYFLGFDGGYSAHTRSVLDGGLDWPAGWNIAGTLGVIGMLQDWIGIRGAVRFQYYDVDSPTTDNSASGFRLLLMVGQNLGW